MIKTFDRYILRQVIVTSATMVGIALLVLLLERLLRLLNRVVDADQVLGYVSQMLVTLIPHYLGVALPLAFFLGVILTFNRLNRDSELMVMAASGAGLRRLMAPVMGLALVLTLLAAATFSYLQPLGRYAYRSLSHTVAHASLSAAVKEGTFIHTDDMTFIAEGTADDSRNLSRVFVYEQRDAETSFVTTANDAALHKSAEGLDSVLVLRNGRRSKIGPEGGGTLTFDQFRWPITSSAIAFRARGKDERELTLPELWAAMATPFGPIKLAEARAELHARLVRMSTILILPLLAIPLALGGGRGGQSYGVAVGLLVLVVYEQVVKFGESLAFKVPRGRLWVLPPPSAVLLVLKRRFRPRRRRPS
jgi:lipopolysaccharide export system permease protein